jgi:CBS domain-containing protein
LQKNSPDILLKVLSVMRRRKVDEILLPYEDGVPLDPSVTIGDRIITAIELMVGKNLKQIAVVRNQRPVGMVRLEDAFKKIGLTMTEAQARGHQ